MPRAAAPASPVIPENAGYIIIPSPPPVALYRPVTTASRKAATRTVVPPADSTSNQNAAETARFARRDKDDGHVSTVVRSGSLRERQTRVRTSPYPLPNVSSPSPLEDLRLLRRRKFDPSIGSSTSSSYASETKQSNTNHSHGRKKAPLPPMADVIAIDDGPSPQPRIHRRVSSPEFMICEKASGSKRKDASAEGKGTNRSGSDVVGKACSREATVARGGLNVDDIEAEISCPICMGILVEAVALECGHIFCASCGSKWMRSHNNCPVRRKVVNQARKSPLVRVHMIDAMVQKWVAAKGKDWDGLADWKERNRSRTARNAQATSSRMTGSAVANPRAEASGRGGPARSAGQVIPQRPGRNQPAVAQPAARSRAPATNPAPSARRHQPLQGNVRSRNLVVGGARVAIYPNGHQVIRLDSDNDVDMDFRVGF